MYGSGAGTGMTVIRHLPSQIHLALLRARIACPVAVVGITTSRAAVCRTATPLRLTTVAAVSVCASFLPYSLKMDGCPL